MSLSRWLQRAIVILFHFLVLTTPFIFTWVNEELFEFNKMLWVYAGATLILGLWTARMVIEKRWLIRRTPLDWVLGAFVLSQFLSTIFSIHPRTSWLGYYSRFHGGFLSTLSYVSLYYALASNFTKKQVLALLITVMISSLGVALYSLPEHWGHSPSCWLISGGGEFDVSCWVQDVQNRIFGSFGQPNWLAAYTLMVIPVGLGLALTGLTPAIAGLGGLAAVLSTVTLLFTKSRSGFLGLAAGMVVLLGGVGIALCWDVIQKWRKATQTSVKVKKSKRVKTVQLSFSRFGLNEATHWLPRSHWLLGGAAVAVIMGVAILLGTPFSPSLATHFSSLSEEAATPVASPPVESGGTDSGEIRKIVWEGAIKVWQRYPLLGSGVETFAYSYYQDRPLAHNNVSEWDFLYNKAHNEFLNFLSTSGTVGFLTYTALLLWFGFWTVKQLLSAHSPSDKILLSSLVASVVGLSISNFFGFSTVMVTMLWFVLMAVAVTLVAKPETAPAEADTASPAISAWQTSQLVGFVLVVTASVYGLVKVTTWWLADFYFTEGKHAYQRGDALKAGTMFHNAITLSPNEALFHDELAALYANAAVASAQEGKLEDAQQLATASLAASDTTLALNPRHLNFYKTRARIFIVLGQLNPEFLQEALTTLQTAFKLAPTDPKLLYNQALVENTLGQMDTARTHLEETLQMKPDYHAARFELAKLYENDQQLEAARNEYQKLHLVAPDDPTIAERLKSVEASLSAQASPQPRSR